MQTSKPAIAHLRNLKRFVKLLTTNLIDIYPAKSEYLPAIIQEVRNLSRQKMRLSGLVLLTLGCSFLSSFYARWQLYTALNQLFLPSQASNLSRNACECFKVPLTSPKIKLR